MKKYFNKEYLLANKDKILKAAVIAAVIITALVVFGMNNGDGEELVPAGTSAAVSGSDEADSEEDSSIAVVDVSGCVVSPMVVELKKGSRINDAIEAAGGLTKDADISAINRAAKVKDGDKIFVPEKGSGASASVSNVSDDKSSGSGGGGIANGRVNINTADSAELQTLTGVGPAIAGRIIAYREQNGNFSKPEDIKNVSGIGDKTYEKMKDDIST
ncbi:MAG: helix-hairpin-helix domain-containing protein [Eubacteriaceae bacterium]|jgi:competence protein ComEA|nr:helix-hairpin-helix domain-containing protein [Eubacteriaceae bacterium]